MIAVLTHPRPGVSYLAATLASTDESAEGRRVVVSDSLAPVGELPAGWTLDSFERPPTATPDNRWALWRALCLAFEAGEDLVAVEDDVRWCRNGARVAEILPVPHDVAWVSLFDVGSAWEMPHGLWVSRRGEGFIYAQAIKFPWRTCGLLRTLGCTSYDRVGSRQPARRHRGHAGPVLRDLGAVPRAARRRRERGGQWRTRGARVAFLARGPRPGDRWRKGVRLMAVQFSPMPVTLKGISQKSPSNLSVPGELTDARNVQILKGGPNGFELSKRYGTRPLQALTDSISGITAANPMHLTTLGDTLVMDNSQALFVRGLSPDAWLTRDKGGFNWSSQSENVSQSNYQKTFPSHAYDAASGNEIIAWYDQADRPRYSVRVRATGTWVAHEVVLASPANFAANYKVQAFAPGNGYFYVFAPGAPGNTLVITQISCTMPLVNSTAATMSLDATGAPFDVQQTPEGLLLIAAKSVGLNTTTILLWNPTTLVGVAATTINTIATAAPNSMWLSQDPWPAIGARSYYLATVDSTNGVRYWQFDATSLAVTGPTVSDATNFNCNMVGFISSGSPQILTDVVTIGYGHGCYLKLQGVIYQRTVTLASKAFRQGGVWYCLVRYDSPVQPTLWLFDIFGKRVVGKVGLIGAQWSSLANTYGQPPWVTQIGNVAVIAAQASHESLGQLASNPIGTQIQGIAIVSFNGAPSTSKPAELGNVLHYPGSIPWIFDGAVCTESGFNLYPRVVAHHARHRLRAPAR
jgi:hypothetical protein